MKEIKAESIYHSAHMARFKHTLDFLEDLNLKGKNILNLGPDNPMSMMLREKGFQVEDTSATLDLDFEFDIVKENYDAVFAFEILEHLVSPFPLLRSIKADKFVASVPLSLWFAKAYWNEKDPYDRHYHEFEPRQFKMLLEKSGWKVVKEASFKSKGKITGIRPFLRWFTPRHYFCYCERDQ